MADHESHVQRQMRKKKGASARKKKRDKIGKELDKLDIFKHLKK